MILAALCFVLLSSVCSAQTKQMSGDYCVHIAAVGGYSFGDIQGFIAGGEVFYTHRMAPKAAWLLGVGGDHSFGTHKVNAVYGKGGFQWLPIGANSPFIIEGGLKAGWGETPTTTVGQTSTGSYEMAAKEYRSGFMGALYAKVNYHIGRVCLFGQAEGRTVQTFATTFKGNPDYTGKALNKGSWSCILSVGMSLSL